MALRDLFIRIKGDNSGAKKAIKDTESDVKGLSKGVDDLKGTFMAAAAAGAAAFAVLINWAKDTDFGLQAINKTLAIGKQLLTDMILKQGLNLREAGSIADRQSRKVQEDIKEGYIVKTMQSELNQLRVQAIDHTKTHAERLQVLTQAIEKEKQLKEFLLNDAREELAIAYDHWKLNIQSIEAKKAYYEIAGKVREIEGMNSWRLQSMFTQELVNQKKRAEELVDAFTPLVKTLEEIKKEAGEATRAMTGQMSGLLQNNNPSSVFGKKTFGLSSPLSGKLAGGPSQYGGTSALALQMANDLQAALNSDAVMKASETFAEDWQKTWEGAIQSVTSLLSDSFISVFEGLGEGNLEGLGKNMLGSMGKLVADLGKMLVALGTTWLTALTLIKTPTIPSAIAAIAAGGVAMAIGGLMIGASKKAASGMESGSYSSGGGGFATGGMSSQKIIIEGKLVGRDIYWSGRRFENELKAST